MPGITNFLHKCVRFFTFYPYQDPFGIPVQACVNLLFKMTKIHFLPVLKEDRLSFAISLLQSGLQDPGVLKEIYHTMKRLPASVSSFPSYTLQIKMCFRSMKKPRHEASWGFF